MASGITPRGVVAAMAMTSAFVSLGCDSAVTEPLGPLTITAEWSPPSGTPMVGTIGAQTIGVRVLNAAGRPVRGLRIGFVDLQNAGTISRLVASTDADGLAVAEWTLGTLSGARLATAFFISAADSQRVLFPLTLAPGPAVTKDFFAADSSVNIGQSVPTTTRFRDAYANASPPPEAIAYTSSRLNVATVSTAGVIQAVGPGFSWIFMRSGTFRDSLRISVRSATPAPIVTKYSSPGDQRSIAFTPNGVALTVAPYAPVIRRFDAVTLTELPSIELRWGAGDIAVRPGFTQAVVATQTDSLLLVDFVADSVIRSIGLPGFASRVFVSPDGAFVYATSLGSVLRISLSDDNDVVSLYLGPYSGKGIALSNDGSILFLSTEVGHVFRIQTATMSVTHTVQLGGTSDLQGLALSGDETRLAVVAAAFNQLITMSADALSDFRGAPLANGFDVIADPTGPRFMATSLSSGAVSFFDQETMETLLSVNTAFDGRRFAREPGTTNIWQVARELVRVAFQ